MSTSVAAVRTRSRNPFGPAMGMLIVCVIMAGLFALKVGGWFVGRRYYTLTGGYEGFADFRCNPRTRRQDPFAPAEIVVAVALMVMTVVSLAAGLHTEAERTWLAPGPLAIGYLVFQRLRRREAGIRRL